MTKIKAFIKKHFLTLIFFYSIIVLILLHFLPSDSFEDDFYSSFVLVLYSFDVFLFGCSFKYILNEYKSIFKEIKNKKKTNRISSKKTD